VRHTPLQNGLAERKNWSNKDTTRAALHAGALGTYFWAEAVPDTIDKHNHMPAAATGRVPHAEFYGTKPSVSTFLAFGQQGHVLDAEGIKHKLKDRSRPARYLSRKGESIYRIYYIDTNTFGTARAADFLPYNPSKGPRCYGTGAGSGAAAFNGGTARGAHNGRNWSPRLFRYILRHEITSCRSSIRRLPGTCPPSRNHKL
jgi:hypothetical protein